MKPKNIVICPFCSAFNTFRFSFANFERSDVVPVHLSNDLHQDTAVIVNLSLNTLFRCSYSAISVNFYSYLLSVQTKTFSSKIRMEINYLILQYFNKAVNEKESDNLFSEIICPNSL